MSILPSSLFPLPSSLRRGSALLIVLGMTAFMVISAVAFSAFMRYSRLPSSYLRRTSSSRHIVKAALAEAIDQIDIAIGNDPFTFEFKDQGDTTAEGDTYPNNGYYSPRADDNQRKIVARRARRNYWRGHCFIGTNSLVHAGETISTLTLEALAYLPPALINEARYYSRHSVAGRWHSLGFDVGRYAYCAVDISDHIDVNRVLANMGRNSSDRGRITLAHVFEHGSPGTTAAGWDTFMKQFLEVDDIKDGEPNAYTGTSKLPLISLADLNLAINKQGWMQMTPFCDYVVNQKNDYISSAGQDSEVIRQMAFVTDSYFPNTNTSTTAKYDLCCSQPFRRIETGNAQMNVNDIMGNNNPMMTDKLLKHISDIDKIALYDYLDGNDIPASLALPSVERVPMVCGIQPQGKIDFEVKQSWGEGGDPSAVAPTAADPMTKSFEKVYKIDNAGMNQVMLSGLFLYPFRRDDAQNPPMGGFKAEYAVRLGFCDISTGNGRGPGLRTKKSSPFVVQNKNDFSGEAKRLEGGVIKLFKQGRSVGSKKVNEEKDAVELDSPVEMADFSDKLNGQVLFKVKYTYHKVPIQVNGNTEYKWDDPEPDQNATPWVNGDFFPLAADGSSLRDTLVNKLKTQGEIETRPFLTVTVRVTQGDKTVDLVPASMIDDQKYNIDVNNSDVATMQEFGGIGGIADNGQQPVITVSGDASQQTFKFGESGTGRFQADLKPANGGNSFICPDPRWNFAPENFGVTSEALQAGDWFIQKCGTGSVVGGGNGRRDNDVFMACSNQGYMQSPSEIAFLPRTIDRELKGDQVQETMSGDIALNQRIGNYADGMAQYNAPSDIGNLLHGAFMWRTYTPYAKNGFGADELYEFGVTSGGTGYRVNPYSASSDILMAALAHAPYSWWAASTNDNSVAFQAADNAETFNRTYAFCEDNNDAEMAWDDLKKVAAELKNKMRDPDGDWEYGYDDAWNIMNDAQANGKNTYRDYLCGVELSGNTCDLYEVDRKFLYGFWRDSFAAKQQLFLIFVRAEPMMMGGGAVGQTPPQLGARAVALVWRDPNPTREDVGNNQQPRPHRTRILFYRQFD